jgi:undecaprenyl-diphosphatase
LGLLLLLWPLLIGFTRLYLDVHWSSDILAGWGLGLLITSLAALLILPDGNDDGTSRSP